MRLVLAGRGLSRDNAELTRLLDGSRLADCVVPLGPVSDMPAHMNAADIVLLASGYGEALPIALIEAAACERAIVSTHVGDVAAIGIPPDRLVPADDLAGFAEALVREGAAWRDGSSRARLAATARHARQGFSLDACVGAYEALYRELAARDRA
jgi:glycosyltransferase involved in cell wall biosynthesis